MSPRSFLSVVREVFHRRVRRSSRPLVRRRNLSHVENLEPRRVMAFDFVSAFPNAGALITEGITEHQSPQQITIRFSPGVEIDPASLGGIVVTRSGGANDPFGAFGNSNDIVVTPGSITVDDLPNENQVIVRFAETLPDDSYRITISGAGVMGLKTLAQTNGAATVPAE